MLWIVPVASALAPVVIFTLVVNTRSKEILKKDNWGLVTLIVGLVMVLAGFNLNLAWAQIWLLTIGGFLSGFGGLVALPDPISDKVTNRDNIFWLVVAVGILLVGVWGWEANRVLAEAWRQAMENMASWVWWSLVGGLALLGTAGAWRVYKIRHP